MKPKALAAGTVVAIVIDALLPDSAPLPDRPESVAVLLVALSLAAFLHLRERRGS